MAAQEVDNRTAGMRRRVVIICKDLPHYRVTFFERLRDRLARLGVELHLVYGQPVGAALARGDTRDLEWGDRVRSRTITVGGRVFYWQPVLGYVRDADLVVVEQASRLMVNYALLALRAAGRTRLAFWGHGRNFQSVGPRGPAEAFKRWYSRQADWWFAYNETSAAAVRRLGYPESRITTVQNAIDTRSFGRLVAGVTDVEVRCFRQRERIGGARVCLFVGGMYPERRLRFLVEAALLVKMAVPGFELVLVGAGSDQITAEAAARENRWIHYLGPRFDRELAICFAASELVLMPGIVGLGVLDCFAAGVPMVTTACPGHGPEIEYLLDGDNGIVVQDSDSCRAYADAVVAILVDDARRQALVMGCDASAHRYTVETMVERFAAGLISVLDD